ncbi:BTB/POZ domain-containing protein 18 [Ambystoma mexicanum]|uniref:BTB/POZ domain-containing protein 18 n=1 Tax=Ambystoma mexicanum TaxID=8296 RepID=UPI0037E74860
MSTIVYRSSRLLRATFQQLHHQQKSGTFCDVILQAEGEGISVHACVLSACSPFFTERLTAAEPAGQTTLLVLPGVMPSTLHKLVHYLYTSELEVTREEVGEVLEAARRLRIPELEVLQLQGLKLVRTDSWPRLNRKCFQTGDQTSLQASAMLTAPREIKQERTHCPIIEKCRVALNLEYQSSRLNDTMLPVGKCLAIVGAGDGIERHTDSEPSCSPFHTHSEGSERSMSLNSPTASSCESLDPVSESNKSPNVSGSQPLRPIKLSRLKFSMPPNNARMPAPVKCCDKQEARDTWCQEAPIKETDNCSHITSSKISRPFGEKSPPLSLMKTIDTKSIANRILQSCPSEVSCDISGGEHSLGPLKVIKLNTQSDDVQVAHVMSGPAWLPTRDSPSNCSFANKQRDSIESSSSSLMRRYDIPEGVQNMGQSTITNLKPQLKDVHKMPPVKETAQLVISDSANALSFAKRRNSTSSSFSKANCDSSVDKSNMGQSKIKNLSPQSDDVHKNFYLNASSQLPTRESANTLSPAKNQRGHIGLSAPTSLGESNNGQCEIRSEMSSYSGDSNKAHPMKYMARLPIHDSANICSPTDDPRSRTMPSESPSQQTFRFSTEKLEGSHKISPCDNQLDLMLGLPGARKPLYEQYTNLETNIKNTKRDPVLTSDVIAESVGEEDGLDTRLMKPSAGQSEGQESKKRHKKTVETIMCPRKDVPSSQDRIKCFPVKQEDHDILIAAHMPQSASIQDRVRSTKCQKRRVASDKIAGSSSKKKRHRDCPSTITKMPSLNPRGSGATPISSLSQGTVNGGSDVVCPEKAVSENPTRDDGPTLDPALNCLLESLLESTLPDENADIDVGTSEWNGEPGLTHCCVRPDPTSESDTDVDILN